MPLKDKLKSNRKPSDRKSSEHHRKPTSIKGNDNVDNIKMIPHDIHMKWHAIVANKCAPKIAQMLAAPYRARRYKIDCVRMHQTVHKLECPTEPPCSNTIATKKNDFPQCAHIHWTQREEKLFEELRKLIGSETKQRPTLLCVTKYINDHLLDPDYRLVLQLLKKH